jgi:hypothetical protein
MLTTQLLRVNGPFRATPGAAAPTAVIKILSSTSTVTRVGARGSEIRASHTHSRALSPMLRLIFYFLALVVFINQDDDFAVRATSGVLGTMPCRRRAAAIGR